MIRAPCAKARGRVFRGPLFEREREDEAARRKCRADADAPDEDRLMRARREFDEPRVLVCAWRFADRGGDRRSARFVRVDVHEGELQRAPVWKRNVLRRSFGERNALSIFQRVRVVRAERRISQFVGWQIFRGKRRLPSSTCASIDRAPDHSLRENHDLDARLARLRTVRCVCDRTESAVACTGQDRGNGRAREHGESREGPTREGTHYFLSPAESSNHTTALADAALVPGDKTPRRRSAPNRRSEPRRRARSSCRPR